MNYRVELEGRARKEFLALPRELQERLTSAIDDLEKEPRPPSAKKLVGNEGYRIRKGSYRILYVINDQKRLLRIFRIGHRRDVYRKL